MTRITTGKPFLYILLICIVAMSVIERLQIGGWDSALAWGPLIFFPGLHFTLHIIYLLRIHYVKRKHLGIILFSHLAYFLFFIFEYDRGEGPGDFVITHVVRTYSPLSSDLLFNELLKHIKVIFCSTLIFYLLAETIFAIRIRQYIRTEALVIN